MPLFFLDQCPLPSFLFWKVSKCSEGSGSNNVSFLCCPPLAVLAQPRSSPHLRLGVEFGEIIFPPENTYSMCGHAWCVFHNTLFVFLCVESGQHIHGRAAHPGVKTATSYDWTQLPSLPFFPILNISDTPPSFKDLVVIYQIVFCCGT